MSVILKTRYWQVKDYNAGFGVFSLDNYDDREACRVCAQEALAGDLEAVMAIEMCGVDGMLMREWNIQLQEKAKWKPKA